VTRALEKKSARCYITMTRDPAGGDEPVEGRLPKLGSRVGSRPRT